MIITEIVTLNNKEFKKTYSNENYYIQKVGTDKIYEEAYDTLDSTYEYVETDIDIEDNENEKKFNEIV